jgi:hypothetical protein
VKFRFPRRRARRDKYAAAAAELGNALGQSLRLGAPLAIKHEHVYGARPPLPKPARMMVAWQLQNGTELKTYVPMYGQRETVISWPRFLDPAHDPANWPPVLIRFEFEYDER